MRLWCGRNRGSHGKAGASEMRSYQYGATDLPRGSGGGVSAQCDAQNVKDREIDVATGFFAGALPRIRGKASEP